MNSTTVTTVTAAPATVTTVATTAAAINNNSTTIVSNQSRPSIINQQPNSGSSTSGGSSHNSDRGSGAIPSSSPNLTPLQQQATLTTVTTQSTTTTTAASSSSSSSNITNKSKQQASVTSNGSISESITAGTEGHRTPNVDLLSKTNLYIRGLQTNTSDQDLYKMCARFGQISSTKAILDKNTGCCRGYGFVEFTSSQSAELAVQELTKSGIQAQMAKISPLYSPHHHHNHHQNNNNNNNHHHHHNHHHPHHHHNDNNNINNNSNPNNSAIGGSGGGSSSGGSTIKNTSSNISTTGTHPITPINNNSSSQQHQQHYQNSPNNNNADPTNLYIANLPPNMSEQELENLLSIYGPVVSTRILRDQSNIPRGVGFARMESRDKCEQIIEQLNGRPCKGWNEPLLIKFADGGTKKRHNHHNNHHQHQHHNNNQHQPHKSHQDDSRWRESGNPSDLGSVSNFDHQSNIPHSNHLSDLAMMNTMSYPRIQPGFPSPVAPGSAYPPHLGPPTNAPQWIHPGGPGQPYVISQQMIQAAGLGPSNQVAAAAALHYGHIPQLTSQMQGLQISHPGAPLGGYLPPQHQWSALWTHPQPQASMRLATPMQPHPPSHQQQRQQQQTQQLSPQATNPQQHQPPTPQQQQSAIADNKLQISMPL